MPIFPGRPSGWPSGRIARSIGQTFASATIAVLLAAGCDPSFEATQATDVQVRQTVDWPSYGGGAGQRYSPLDLITPANVADLETEWIHRHGDVSDGRGDIPSTSSFQVTPIVADGRLFYCTPFNRVYALDPLTGGELWKFDPGIDLSGHYANQLVCRGVAYWRDPDGDRQTCSARVFTATNNGYLIALDAQTGMMCPDFGDDGRVNLNRGVGDQEWLGEYQVTSAPTVISGGVVVGSAISDNARIDAPSGVVRSFDVRTGAQRWAWDLAPPDFDYATDLVSDEGHALGTPNVWGTMVADVERDLLVVPTGNPAPDYFRSGKPDMDHYGTAVVALRGTTGEVVWKFNTVINDFWDYDVGGQPSLADVTIDGERRPAVIAGTKMGFVFVLDRDTGVPLIDVEYRGVPVEGPLADQLSPVQPFPPEAFRVAREMTDEVWGIPGDKGSCTDFLEAARIGPIYTPITEQWTVIAPNVAGGINWGGVAVDPIRGLIAARSSNVPFAIRLIPRADFSGEAEGNEFSAELAPQRGTPYAMARRPLLSAGLELPCNPPPWGEIGVIDIAAQATLWRQPHGTVRDLAGVPLPPLNLGVPGLGGPLLTRSGLLFAAGAAEHAIRAFDVESGNELWSARLPAGPQATPMTYGVKSDDGRVRQFVVIAAGGHGGLPVGKGDHLVAFALPQAADSVH